MFASPRRWLWAALASLLLVLPALGMARAESAFTGGTGGPVSTWQAASRFGTGELLSWGDDGTFAPSPAQVGAATGWSAPAAGEDFACGLRSGTLWCWGRNGNGRLGKGDTVNRIDPTQVGSATTWSSVTAGLAHACGTRTDGTLWCWGENGLGQLGVGNTTNQYNPTQVTSPATTGWASVSAGSAFTCATRTTGALYCWGLNNVAQLGIGSTVNQTSPAQVTVPGTTGWTAVRTGWQHACGLRSATLYCWGDGGGGRLGLGGTANQSAPVQVAGTTWAQVSLGADHSCGLKSDGTLWCWGTGADYRTGLNTTADTLSPAQLGNATTWRAVGAGGAHACATRTDNTLWCWGDDQVGQLGLGATGDRTTPTQVGAPASWSTLGVSAVQHQTCVTRTDGTLWCWGDTGAFRTDPAQVGTATTWAAVAAGEEFACATRTDGTLWCWGRNGSGRLGQGDLTHRAVPVKVGTGTTWSSVATGVAHACATRTDQTLWCWGENGAGQVGVGNTTNQYAPTQVTSPAAGGWVSVTAGARYTCATRTGGALFCWGENNAGQLGAGHTNNSSSPLQVTVPSGTGWTDVRAGWQHTCGLRSALLYCWGDGGYGRLGLGTQTQHTAPQQVPGTTWSQLSLGADHSCAIRTDATLWCWGSGWEGRLGSGGTADELSPRQVGAATTWRSVSAGRVHTCGTQTGATTWCWGGNGVGQLGAGDTTARSNPAQVPGVAGRPVVTGPASWLTLLLRW